MDQISFTINGEFYLLDPSQVPIDTTLNSFIRYNAQLPGTKFMCLEGGCGACIVTATGPHPVTKNPHSWAVNSCLMNIYSCQGLDITTVEGVGNKKDGYHPLQMRLANLNGTQCGYCSPGMIMNMYSLMEKNSGKVSMGEVENSFGGNICRCTGYRPILDAFKSFATDANENLRELCKESKDIEDLHIKCKRNPHECSRQCPALKLKPFNISFNDGKQFYKVSHLEKLFEILSTVDKPYMLVAGNTAHGVFRRDPNLEIFIDINNIEDLHKHSIGNELNLGGNVSLTEAMKILTEASKLDGYEYCKEIVNHIDLIANIPVRNAGSLAGNLTIKHAHNDFPSDLYISLEAVNAQITLLEANDKKTNVSVADYLKTDMNRKIIYNISLPRLNSSTYKYKSYKIMPRAQNAHAYVNAGFLAKFSTSGLITSIRICFGGITPEFSHASKTEQFLVGKDLYSNDVIKLLFPVLSSELNPDWVLPDASPNYRRNLAMALFYKFILNTCPSEKLTDLRLKSGGEILERPLSFGTQTFDTYKDKWPLTQNVPKYEGLQQCAGELTYVNDLPYQKGELWAAFVPATKVHEKIVSIDASNALKIPGVKFFFSAKDIPGRNNFSPTIYEMVEHEEKIFVDLNGEVQFYGQPAGIILAKSMSLAIYAVNFVNITYQSVMPNIRNHNGSNGLDKRHPIPILPTVSDVLEYKDIKRIRVEPFNKVATTYGLNATKNVAGKLLIGGQYHYTMETMSAICVPSNHGMDVRITSQFVDYSQTAIAEALNVPNNSLNIIFQHLGGGYGMKISRISHVACACALACHLTNLPVRFVMTLESNMTAVGKRYSTLHSYNVDVDDNGKIQKLESEYNVDYGNSYNDAVTRISMPYFNNCYNNQSWDVKANGVLTDSPSNTWCRAPGTTEGIAMIESIMEHIARICDRDPIDVRLSNIPNNHLMRSLIPDFLKDIDFKNRKQAVDQFNAENRWRKRGIAIAPMEYAQLYFGHFPVFVAIYHSDGTVVVKHGGVECGQGINTKVQQVAAHILSIPLELVSIKPMDNVVGANAFRTGASLASEVVCFATKKACEKLLARMAPIKAKLINPKWHEITMECYKEKIDLTAKYMYTPDDLKEYTIYGVSCAEVEIDLLSGNLQLRRVDILEDTGESMSPGVDVGQVEGAFIMGVGYWLTERLVYNQKNGELLTNRTWTYKPPGIKDIPVDFRIKFLQKSSNEAGVLRSKATGEPPLCMSIVVVFALRHALDSARSDAGIAKSEWYELNQPVTPEVILLSAGNKTDDFII